MVTFKKDASGACSLLTRERHPQWKLRLGTKVSFLLGKSLPSPAGGEVPSGARRVVNFLSQTLARLGTPRDAVGRLGAQSVLAGMGLME